jgi:hypothetical protein
MLFVSHLAYPLAAVLAIALPVHADAAQSDSALQFPVGAGGLHAPVSWPLSNGFPYITNGSKAWEDLTVQAHGSISNAPSPPSIAPEDAEYLKVIYLQEMYEVWFMTQVLQNITNNATGFEITDPGTKTAATERLIGMQAVEMWHALQAQSIVEAVTGATPQPCTYQSPVATFEEAMLLLVNITGVVMASLEDVAAKMAKNGDIALIKNMMAIESDESGQQGWLRTKFSPGILFGQDNPFMTASAIEYAYSFLKQHLIVDCPAELDVNVQVYEPLNLVTPYIAPVDQTLDFNIKADSVEGLWVTYINQLNVPSVVKIVNATVENGVAWFQAEYPYTEQHLFGLSVIAVTNSSGPFVDANDVAAATVYAPALAYPN